MPIRIGFYTILFLMASHLSVQSQVKFYAIASEQIVTVDRTFQVSYIIEGAKDIRQFNIPHFRDFRVEGLFDIPGAVIVNQQLPDRYQRVVILSPKNKGRFTIPAATAIIDGKSMRSTTARVVVQPSAFSHMSEDIDTEEESELQPEEDVTDKISKNFFLKVQASKTSCYVGEPLMAVYKAYSRLNASSQVVKRPSFTGFSVMEMVDAYDGKPEIEILDGRPYYTNLIRKVQLFPLQEGKFELDPAEIETTIHFIRMGEGGINFNYKTILRTEPLAITVKPLPLNNQPADFKGAVGKFKLTVHTPKTTVAQGDLVKIQLVVSGSGNISLLTPPVMHWPAGIDTAEPVVKENFNKYAFPLSGSKTFEYSFAVRDTGDYIIPKTQYPYYDPEEKKYKAATGDSIVLHVVAAAKKTDGNDEQVISGKEVPLFPRQVYWFALVVVLIIGWIVYQAVLLRKKKPIQVVAPAEETVEVKPPLASEILATAQYALQQGDQAAFYHEVQESLWKVIVEKCEVLPSSLNKRNVAVKLADIGVSTDVIQNLLVILDECEWALYTPDQSIQDMRVLLQRAEDVLKQLLAA